MKDWRQSAGSPAWWLRIHLETTRQRLQRLACQRRTKQKRALRRHLLELGVDPLEFPEIIRNVDCSKLPTPVVPLP